MFTPPLKNVNFKNLLLMSPAALFQSQNNPTDRQYAHFICRKSMKMQ